MNILKGQEKQLAKGLMHSEFQCSCNYKECQMTIVRKELLKAYEALRIEVDIPLKIGSGFRCQRHNHDISALGSSKRSAHCSGEAIDIHYVGALKDKYSPEEFTKLIIKHGFVFTYFNKDKSFFHLQVLEKDGDDS